MFADLIFWSVCLNRHYDIRIDWGLPQYQWYTRFVLVERLSLQERCMQISTTYFKSDKNEAAR